MHMVLPAHFAKRYSERISLWKNAVFGHTIDFFFFSTVLAATTI